MVFRWGYSVTTKLFHLLKGFPISRFQRANSLIMFKNSAHYSHHEYYSQLMQRIVILVVNKACFHKLLLFAWGEGE